MDTLEGAAGHITDGTGLVGNALGEAYNHAADKATARTVLSFLANWHPFQGWLGKPKQKTAIFEGSINRLNVVLPVLCIFAFCQQSLINLWQV